MRGQSASAKRCIAPMIVHLVGPRQSDRELLDVFTPSGDAYAGWLADRSHVLDRAASVHGQLAARSMEYQMRYSMRGEGVG